MKNPYHYRNKGQIPVGVKEGQVQTGFYRIHSNDIIDMNACMIQHESINQILQETKTLLQKYIDLDVDMITTNWIKPR